MTAISTNTGQLQHLLWGVIGAMSASLLGLLLTIYNSAKGFKEATTINDQYKELFFDFLRQELMPVLSNTMSQSLNSLRGVLGHFVDSFGRNLDSYADSAEMLNDNLEKQHLVLQELNNLSLTKTSMRIAETFKTLDESAKSLEVFYSYHKQLNSTISNLDKTASKVDSIIEAFRDFTTELHLLAENQNTTIKLQQDFSEAINTHFPIGGEGREVWRKEFDTLIEDAQITTDQLSKQLTNSTQYIANFVDNNSEFFESLAKLNDVVDTLVKYTNIQAQSYTQLSQEFVAMRKDYKEVQNETLELSKLTIEAIKEMTKQIKDIKK
jgi:methyl-accepting chemotaxis protein